MNDLEEEYTEKIEREGEIFLEGLQNKRSLKELEKEYSKKVKEIRRIYEKSLRKELEKEKNKQIKEAKKGVNLEFKEDKEFQVEKLNLEKNWKEKKQIEVTSLGYRFKRRIKGFIKKILPDYLIYMYYKIKRFLKDFFKDLKRITSRIWNKASEKISNTASLIKRGFLKIIYKLIFLWNFIVGKITKHKNGSKKEDNPKIKQIK